MQSLHTTLFPWNVMLQKVKVYLWTSPIYYFNWKPIRKFVFFLPLTNLFVRKYDFKIKLLFSNYFLGANAPLGPASSEGLSVCLYVFITLAPSLLWTMIVLVFSINQFNILLCTVYTMHYSCSIHVCTLYIDDIEYIFVCNIIVYVGLYQCIV